MRSVIDVKQVAEVARLHLTEAEVAVLQADLERTCAYLEKLSALDLTAVEPLVYGQEGLNSMRADEVQECAARAALLSNGYLTAEMEFKLPKIVEEA